MERARRVDPFSPLRRTCVGIPYYYARQYDEAIEQFRKGLEIDPNFGVARFRLALAYGLKGIYEESISEFQKMLSLFRDRDTVTSLGYVYTVSGKRDEARDAPAELTERTKREYVPFYDVAIIHVGLGETDRAFEKLKKASDEHSYFLTFLFVDPILDGLRSDPRFTDLVRRVGIAK